MKNKNSLQSWMKAILLFILISLQAQTVLAKLPAPHSVGTEPVDEYALAAKGNPEVSAQANKLQNPQQDQQNSIVAEQEVDVKPTFKEGKEALTKFMGQNIRYPANTDAEGTVEIEFPILEDGSIGEVVIKKPVDKLLDEEVQRVVEMTQGRWQPAQKDGKAVASIKNMTFSFRIDDGSKKEPIKADFFIVKYK